MARFTQPIGEGGGIPGPQGESGNDGTNGADGLDSLFLGTWNSVTEFLAVYQGGPVGLADGDWWAFVKDNTDPNKIYVVREDVNSATGWVIDDNESFVLPAGAQGDPGADGADGSDGAQGDPGLPGADGADGTDALWNYLGEYNGGLIYTAGDVVTYDGQLWYRNVYTSAGYTPGGPEGYWDLLAAKGNDGADGTNGTNGADGNDGSPGLVYLGNYVSGNGYIANLAVVKGSDNNLYIATSSGGLSDPVGNTAEWAIFLPKGADGSNGADGADGSDGSNGTSFIWSAEFDPGTTYPLNYVVSYQGSSYIKIANESVGDFPLPTNNTYWNLVAQKGDQGDPGISGTTAVLAHSVKAGEALTKGQAVYVSSADGTNMIVSKASNAMESTSSKTMGLITTDLSLNGQGTLITEGLLAGLNTNSANAGDPVWLGTDGNLIYGLLNKPSAPAHLVFIGIVTRANTNNGEIFVKCQNGFEVRELHDAVIEANGSVTDNEVFAYDSTSGMWKNQTAAEAGLQALEDTGWQTVSTFANSFTGTNVSYRKINNIVYLRGNVSGGTAGTGAFTLPLGYRLGIEGVYVAQQYGTANMMYVTIGADGVVAPNTTSAWLSGISYPVG